MQVLDYLLSTLAVRLDIPQNGQTSCFPMCTCTHTHTHSFDHDGLGRYGDRLHPDGDLLAMQTVAAVLQDQGLLFLTVPVGQ